MEIHSNNLPPSSSTTAAADDRSYYSIGQAAALLGVSRVSIWRWIRDGRLPAARLGHRTIRITRADLERVLVQFGPSGFEPGFEQNLEAGTARMDDSVRESAPRTEWRDVSPSEHLVQFYDTEAFLLDAMSNFIGAALRAGDSGVIIATPTHRAALEERLSAYGLDLAAARAHGRYVMLDATETLSHLMEDGVPRADRFREVIGDIIVRTAAGGHRVRVFEEMVSLPAMDEDYTRAVRLEEFWNELQESCPFALLCAYPLSCLARGRETTHLAKVCAEHSRVIPAESYTALDGEDRLRVIAVLQHKSQMLEGEIAERTRVEQDLRRADEERSRLLETLQHAHDEAEAAVRRLRAVQAISDAALAHLSIRDLLRELLVRISEVLNVDNTAILIPTDDGRHLLLHMARGPEEQISGQVRVPIGQGIAGTIAGTRQPLVVDDLRRAEVANPFLKQVVRSLMGVPLIVQDRLVGVLHAGTATPRHFTEDDLLLLRLVGDRVALALEHVRLFEEEQRLRAEAADRAVELEATFEAIADGVLVFDQEGGVRHGNRAGRDLLGMHEAATFYARPLGERGLRTEVWDEHSAPLPPAEWPLFRVLRGEVLKGDRAVDLKVRTSRGRERDVSVSGAPIRDRQGTITGAVCVLRDVTEHRRLEVQILAERNRLQQVLDVLPEGVMLAGANPPAVVTMNHAAEELLGVNLVGQSVPILPLGAQAEFAVRRLDGTLYPIEDLPLERALLRGEIVRADQFQIRNARSGREVTILANSAPLRDVKGAIIGAVLVFQDISALKDLEQERERFLATVSHDLKNPLTSILAVSQLLQMRSQHPGDLDQARLDQGLNAIGLSAQRMATQIDELLDGARVRMGRPVRLEFAPTDVVAFVAGLVDEYQRTTEQHTLRMEHTVDRLMSMMDAPRLRRALANLLSNAIKYSPQGGEIVTTLAHGGDEETAWYAIQITDHGVGIPPDEVDRVFDGFYRASNVVGQFTGSGLGLTGVRQIVEQHGGTIALSSTEGVGTTVTVRLPLLTHPAEAEL